LNINCSSSHDVEQKQRRLLKANRCINGKMISALETLSIKRGRVPASTFDPFTDYKKVNDEFELVMGESSSHAMEDLLDVPSDKKR